MRAVVYVFTTNCPIELIDPAFRRPGRIDLTLHFPKPDAGLRRRYIDRWDPEIRAAVVMERVIADTAGMSFAEIEEVKNVLVLDFLQRKSWDWSEALRQFRHNRAEFASDRGKRQLGFGSAATEHFETAGICATS